MGEPRFIKWREELKYLPVEFRDFHDQKDLFKVMGSRMNLPNGMSWVDAHVFIVDYFLWFMAARGYTLQKSRFNGDFHSLESDITEFKKEQDEILAKLINQD